MVNIPASKPWPPSEHSALEPALASTSTQQEHPGGAKTSSFPKRHDIDIHVCTYVYVCTYVNMYIRHVYKKYIYIYISSMCTEYRYTYMYIYIYLFIYTHMYTHRYRYRYGCKYRHSHDMT